MRQRIKKLRAKFKSLKINAFLVTNPAKVRYLTGFNGTEEQPCLITPEKTYLIVSDRDKSQAHQQSKNCKIVIQGFPELKAIQKQNLVKPGQRIGLEGDLSLDDYQFLKKICPQNEFINCGNLIDNLATIKDRGEIQKIQKAIELTEYVFGRHILTQVRPGITENDLAAEISYWGKKYGAEKDAFDIIVASGERSAIPHGLASSKKLKKGEIVQFDFGYVMNGYPSDFSRVVFLSQPTRKQREIYDIVLTAQEMAIRVAKPGMECGDLDRVARDYIKGKGYDFPHSLGHGLGIMIHSAPRVGPKVKTKLEINQVITIEPGIYIPGWGGIRLEDMVLITKKGSKNLTKFTKKRIVK